MPCPPYCSGWASVTQPASTKLFVGLAKPCRRGYRTVVMPRAPLAIRHLVERGDHVGAKSPGLGHDGFERLTVERRELR